MIKSPFGDGIGFAMTTLTDYDELKLHPDEKGLVGNKAVPKRRREFCLGRIAAHAALSKINITDFPILRGAQNEPVWPNDVVGAISHSGEFAMAAAARKETVAGIGVDIEMLDKSVSEDIINVVCTAKETAWVNSEKEQRLEKIFMLFSAKESAFKAFFPITKITLTYLDAEFSWQEDNHWFSGQLLKRVGADYAKGYTFTVGCRKIDRYIFTFMKLPPR